MVAEISTPQMVKPVQIDTLPVLPISPKTKENFEFDIDGKVYFGKLTEPVYFDFGSSVLEESHFEDLEGIAQYMLRHAESKIFVFGHSDDVGLASTNKRISQNRALAIKSYLLSKGIDSKRIFDQGHGHEKPLHPNDSEENRAKNRRVEMVIFK